MQTNRLVKHLIVVDYDCSVLNKLGLNIYIHITYFNHSIIVLFSDPHRERESQDSNWFDIRMDLVNGCCAHFIWCKCVIYIKSACSWTLIYVRSGCDQKKSISFTPCISYST